MRAILQKILEVDTTDEPTDRRHDEVVNNRADNLTERAADDNTDSHINRVAFHGERLKILQKCGF